jgi:hypothetical protein
VLVFDWRTFEALSKLQGHLDIVHLIEKIRSKNLLVTASLDKSLRLWSLPAFSCTKAIAFDGCIVSMSASEEKDLISIFALFEDNVVRRINIENGQTLIRWQLNHDISPAFILVLNDSLFVGWRDSEVTDCAIVQIIYIHHSCSQVMELMISSGKKLSKCVGLYGAPEAITSSAGILYSCCNSGTICCWGSRYLGDSDPKFEIDDCTSWTDVARLNADILSPTVTMSFPLTKFLPKRQHAQADKEPTNLNDSLRRYLGAAPKKDSSKSRPHPILPTKVKEAPQSGTFPISTDDSIDMRTQIRQIWLGSNQQTFLSSQQTSSDYLAGANTTPRVETDRSGVLKRPPKLLQAADFVASPSVNIPTRTRASAVTSLSTEDFNLSEIISTSIHSEPVATESVSSLSFSVDPNAQSSTFNAGKFFMRAQDYLRRRQIVSTNSVDDVQQDQIAVSQNQNSTEIQGVGLRPDERLVNWSHVSNAWGAKPKRESDRLFGLNPK